MITAHEIEKEIMLQKEILEMQGFEPYIIEMPVEYAKILTKYMTGFDVDFKKSNIWYYMNIKLYFGGKGITVCGKAYKS